ncbi:hypothetical protein NQ317_014447 [Molorchus minor]|uniref:Uncharacterized protein n=1 Tax=Molorchus minor TaxID=1323400 RepID=A0ABQ9K843_9CUCU|nr:hypothetical protein NQ317_014447 [Molorchus minor]
MLYWSLLTKIFSDITIDAGVDITTIKRHAGWKSTTVAEGYVQNSFENKTKIANQVLVGTTTSAITKDYAAGFYNFVLTPSHLKQQWRKQFSIKYNRTIMTNITTRGGFLGEATGGYRLLAHLSLVDSIFRAKSATFLTNARPTTI